MVDIDLVRIHVVSRQYVKPKEATMKGFQKIGGYAAILQGLMFIVILVIQFTVLAPQGLAGGNADPAKVVAFAATSPTPFLILNLILVVFSITIILVVLALFERLQAGAPNRMRLAVIAATVASALFLASGLTSFTGFPPIVSLPDTAAAIAGQRALNAVTNGLLQGAVFAAGWQGLLNGWAALSTKGLPSLLGYLLVLAGLLGIAGVFVSILGLIGLVVNVVWGLWLGYVLLTQPSPLAATAMP
jgi:hypothetical protein